MKRLNGLRWVLVTLVMLAWVPGATPFIELFGQSSTQDLALVSQLATISPSDSPVPGSTVVVTFHIVNNGVTASFPFSVAASAGRNGTSEQIPITSDKIVCAACNSGLPGRTPDSNNPGAFLAATPQTALIIFDTKELPEGIYTVTITLNPNTRLNGAPSGAAEPASTDHTMAVEVPLFSLPELHPTALTFSPPSPVPQGAQVRVTATVANSGQRNLDGTVLISFFYCIQPLGEAPCQPDQTQAFGALSSLSLSLRDFATTPSQTRDTILDTRPLSPGLYRIAVRVSVSGTGESDANNNELTSLLTVGGFVPEGGIRRLLVGRGQVGSNAFPIFISPTSNELWALNRTNMQKLLTCGGINIASCSSALATAAAGFVSPIGTVDVDRGTVRIDVLNTSFDNLETATNEEFVINRWQLPAEITAIAQNPISPILYVGLADGRVMRLPLLALFNRLSQITAEELLQSSAITVRQNAAVTTLLPLSNGLVIGTADNDTGRGQVHFLSDLRTSASLISAVAMGSVRKFASTPGFLYVAADSLTGGAPQFFITRIPSGSQGTTPETIFRGTTLQGLSGQFTDFVVNNLSWLFIATSNGTNGTIFSYRLSPSQNSAAPLFEPWVGFNDPDPASDAFLTLSKIESLGLGDVTSEVDGDEILYVGTNAQVYAIQTQRRFGAFGQLQWLINLDGSVTALTVDTLGQTTSGFSLVSTANRRFYVIDGRNRAPTDTQPTETVQLNGPVVARMFSESLAITDDSNPFLITQKDLLISIYGSDALYFTVRPKE